MISLKTNDWKIANVEAILFDKDGTFIDVHLYWGEIIKRRIKAVTAFYSIDQLFFSSLCLSLGLDLEQNRLIAAGPIALLDRNAVINSLIARLKQLKIIVKKEDIEHLFKEVHQDFLPEVNNYIKLIPEAKDLFDRLKSTDVKCGVVTSDVKANTEAILEYLDLKKYFDIIIGKDDCTQAKKTGEPARVAVDRLAVDPLKTISVGDALMDYEMAKNGGLLGSILVATGQTPFEELQQYTKMVVCTLKDVCIEY